MSRGLRNCNPGNLRISNEKWQGEVCPSRDIAFKQFKNMAYGYRAIFKIIDTYYTKYYLKTIKQIISRYAPSNENSTDDYIDFVCKRAELLPDQELSLYDKSTLIRIVSAISTMENGVEAVKAEVDAGYLLYRD